MTERPTWPSRAARVTFFEDRAEVVRRAEGELPAGKTWIAVAGVTPFVDDRSVRATPRTPGPRVLAVRVARVVTAAPAASADALAALEAEEREARRRVAAAERLVARVARRLERLEGQREAWAAGAARQPSGLGEPEALAGWREAYRALDTELRAAVEAEEAALRERADAQEAQAHLAARLRDARAARPRLEAAIEVQLEHATPLRVELELVYRTPCALWRPEHQATLESDGPEAATGKLALVTHAAAWQRTGERWEEVEVAFSTARPGRAASPPRLREDALRSRPKSAEERRQVVIEAREQEVATAGLGRGARPAEEMPGVDDGGEPLELRAAGRVTLEPDGAPLRIELSRAELSAKVDRVLLPELAPVAHVRATATHGADAAPLLAGPVRLLRQTGRTLTAVGRARLRLVPPGEPFELGFGPDDAVRVQRRVDEERTTTPVVGTQHLARAVALFLSNLSTDVKRVLVRERIPVSELEGLEVSLTAAEGWEHDRDDGFLERELELAPRDALRLELRYTLKAGAKVVLPGV